MKHLERLNEVHRLLREANIEHEKHLELLDNVALLVQESYDSAKETWK